MRFSTVSRILLAIILLLPLAACQTNEPRASDPINSANYFLNTLEARTTAELQEVTAAFDTVMGEMDFIRTDLDETDIEAVLTYRGPDDVGVQVKLKQFPRFTNIKIRYSLTGNEYQSRRILEQVVDQL